MRKKRLILIFSLPLAIAVTLGVLAMLPSRSKVTKANYDRIQEGMTKAEVEEIFGPQGRLIHGRCSYWGAGDGSGMKIWFENDCVIDMQWIDSNETFLDKFRRWLHLP
jgi:hypothetical protein